MIDVLHHCGRLPLFSAAGCRAVEAQALAATPDHALMARAGLAVARLSLAIAPHAQRIWIACGPGNNGGDGLIAARHLAAQGREVHLSLFDGNAPAPSDAQWARLAAQEAGLPLGASPHPPEGCDLAIDALLGLGVRRAPEGAIATAIDALNSSGLPVLSVDIPSGLNGDTGQPCPEADGRPGRVVQADHTLSLLGLRPGLFTAQGRDWAGRIWLETLGVEPPAGDMGWLTGREEPARWATGTQRRHASHKGSFGQVLVVGGAAHMAGAAELAASAALAAGAGKVYLKALSTTQDTGAVRRPELMTWPAGEAGQFSTRTPWQDLTLVAGCGAGTSLDDEGLLELLLQRARRLVLDADGLNSLARDASARQQLRARRARGQQTVLTPHPLEAARLLGRSVADVQADRLHATRDLCDAFDCCVVLKGSGTLIASPGEALHVNATGNAALAGAGTGDVLAGWIGGLWAQQTEAPPQALATAAVAWHGLAAEGARAPLRATDLIERMHALQAMMR